MEIKVFPGSVFCNVHLYAQTLVQSCFYDILKLKKIKKKKEFGLKDQRKELKESCLTSCHEG